MITSKKEIQKDCKNMSQLSYFLLGLLIGFILIGLYRIINRII